MQLSLPGISGRQTLTDKDLNRVLLYINTIRYLKPSQVYCRVWFNLKKPKPIPSDFGLRHPGKNIIPPLLKKQSMLAHDTFRFLNKENKIRTEYDWNNPEIEKLWLYNLHYFDDLRSESSANRKEWHVNLIERWMAENPPFSGNGWEPYPLSRRLVNWIFWGLSGNILNEKAKSSLNLQAAFLSRRLEWHILGNHLLANAKALIFAGLFFSGDAAEKWLEKGIRIFSAQLDEQILSDGGHFELSPMYHAQVLEDVLDVINIFNAYPDTLIGNRARIVASFSRISSRMLSWLETMSHPDGEIVLFNDSAFGVAGSFLELFKYAQRLGISPLLKQKEYERACDIEIRHLKESGYIRVDCGDMTAFLDVAEIGADYLPGHAHADTLNFELSIGSQRVIVDGGVSLYEDGGERLSQRGTRAHNTLMIDGADSSEMWGSFRVARRAHPYNLIINEESKEISCSHDGYRRLQGKPVHNRKWSFMNSGLRINDSVYGGYKKASSFLHLHPDVKIEFSSGSEKKGRFILPDKKAVGWSVEGGNVRISDAFYFPEFGLRVPGKCLEINLHTGHSVIEISRQA